MKKIKQCIERHESSECLLRCTSCTIWSKVVKYRIYSVSYFSLSAWTVPPLCPKYQIFSALSAWIGRNGQAGLLFCNLPNLELSIYYWSRWYWYWYWYWSCPYIIEADGIGGAHSRDLFLATAPDLQLNSYQVNHNPGDYSNAREE